MNDVDNYDNLSPNLQISSQRRYWWRLKLLVFSPPAIEITARHGGKGGEKGGLLTEDIKISQSVISHLEDQFRVLNTTIVFWSALWFLSSIWFKFYKATKEVGEQWTKPDFHFTCLMQLSLGWRRREILTHLRKFSLFSEIQQGWLRGANPPADHGKYD